MNATTSEWQFVDERSGAYWLLSRDDGWSLKARPVAHDLWLVEAHGSGQIAHRLDAISAVE